MNKESSEKIQELQSAEQQLQGLMMQRQMIQSEMSEILNALEELSKTKDEVYKISGAIMIKSEKEKITKELQEKKKIFELKISSIEKQERIFEEKAGKIREELEKTLKNNAKN